MSDRYDSVDYQMDEISTYLILRHTFTIPSKTKLAMMALSVAGKLDGHIYDYLCESGSPEEMEHIHNLFPRAYPQLVPAASIYRIPLF